MNSEKANVTLERPLYLLTLEEKVGREKEQLTSLLLSPRGGVALKNSAEESWLSVGPARGRRPYQGAADGADD